MDKSFSQNPYFTGTPYVSYNVLAQITGFNSHYISEIPVFDEEKAILPLALVPMQRLQRHPTLTEISDSEGTTFGIGTVPPGSVLRSGSKGPDVITLPNPGAGIMEHVVRAGNSLWMIAQRYNTTVSPDAP